MIWLKRLLLLTVLVLDIGLSQNDASAIESQATVAKTFAVFSVAYNRQGEAVRGGVCGSAFFISTTRAITAYHVLQNANFQAPEGFEKVRLWLVHEGEPAIELQTGFLTYRPDHDVTEIQLPEERAVNSRYVFAYSKRPLAAAANVETDGIVANTAGPRLARTATGDIEVVAVPNLIRLRMAGQILRRAQVRLSAADVRLSDAPEFELSYRPVVGLSGGPVVSGGEVFAMNSFADPAGAPHTWALDLHAASLLRRNN